MISPEKVTDLSSAVGTEEAEKVSMNSGVPDVENRDNMQQEKLHVEEVSGFGNEMGKRDRNIVENGEERNKRARIEVEDKPRDNAYEMEGEKGSGDNNVQGGKKLSEYPQQFIESPGQNGNEASHRENGGLLVNERSDKIVVHNFAADGGDAGSNGFSENKDEVGRFVPVTPYTVVTRSGEMLRDDSGNSSGTKMIAEDETGTPEDQEAFLKELEAFHKARYIDFKPPKFYGQTLNLLKLYRSVIRLGGYDRVTGIKLWRQIGESFHPPKTCTTVSWTFRIFYEKALLEYERHKSRNGELDFALPEPVTVGNETPGSGRARRVSAVRAMEGWHAHRHYTYGEVGEPVIKDKNLSKREKNLKSIGPVKHKRPSDVENQHLVKAARIKTSKQLVATVIDVGPCADWVKINVQESKDCFEVFALVPGLLREEVRVQSDPAGRLVITGQPEQIDNPWGITAFKKVVSLPGRIDPVQTSAVVSLHGQLFVRVPFEQSNS